MMTAPPAEHTPGVFVATVSADGLRQFSADGTDTAARVITDGYDAAGTSRHRRAASGVMRPEDKILDQNGRARLQSNANDLHRNAILFAWAVRRHLDYTTLFDFQPATGDKGLDADLRALMERDNRPENCDAGGRHSWNRLRRLCEVRKLLDGDVALMTLRTGHLQGVESHMIKNPQLQARNDAARWELGVKLARGRRAAAYCVNYRDEAGQRQERVVPASQMLTLSAFEGRFDQIRGISPIAGALDEFRDVYEIRDLMRAKLKLEQILGVAFFRPKAADSLADEFGTDGDTEGEDETADGERPPLTAIDVGQGVQAFDLTHGDDVKVINGNTPSQQSQEFLNASIAIAIKALDLPFNFFDEAHTNFFGSRAAWIQYERACHSKREDQLELHRRYTLWRLFRWVLPQQFGGTGELILPASMTLESLKWKWVPRGIPWWNPKEELTVDLMAAAAGLKTMQQICDERGLGIWTDNLAALAAEFELAQAAGFTMAFQPQKLPLALSFGPNTAATTAAV